MRCEVITDEDIFLKKNREELYYKLLFLRKEVMELQNLLLCEHTYSEKHIELATYMITVLDDCMVSLYRKERNYRTTVSKYIRGFHNIPKAFFAVENQARVSTEEAYKNFFSYIKCD